MLYGEIQESAVSLVNNIRAIENAFRFISATEHLRGEPRKIEIVLFTSTLLLVKAKNIYWNTTKMHKTMETEDSQKTVFGSSCPRHKDVHWLHHRCYMEKGNVTIECAVLLLNYIRALENAFCYQITVNTNSYEECYRNY